ncbi:telomerase-binding protein EST1A isoform X2 [Ostrinia nubilalis]|uniref:telomerase-binding protein EST1A isoform X2 n=1 Tax=Ostrinia nubilalis TaxID=29057 RepID=UPI0030822C10
MDDDCRDQRRNKPQQKFYKPGSGPLRRSGYGLDAKVDHYGSQNSVNDDLSEPSKEQFNSRNKKPEQLLYVPRSGDSNSDVDRQAKASMRSDNSSQFNRKMYKRQDKSGFNSGAGSYSRGGPRRDRSYGDQYKEGSNNDINSNRQHRQASETRSISPTHCVQEKNHVDRNRDSRSMETSTGRHLTGAGGKPPSGRRNSAGYSSDSSRPKYMVNLDNIPPRFRKRFLEQSGHHSFESMDHLNRDRHGSNSSIAPTYNQSQFYNSNLNWSQTLPSRGRGRLRDNETFDREKFINSYLKNYEVQNSRRSTPSNSYMNLYDPNTLDNKSDPPDMTSSVETEKDFYDSTSKNGMNKLNDVSNNHIEPQTLENDIEHENETISQITTSLQDMTNLDWTEEVEKNIKLDEVCDTSTSFSQNMKSAVSQENKPVEPRESKRSGRSKRKDRRSSSRGQKNSEKKQERVRKDSNASIQHDSDRNRRDSNVSVQHESIFTNLKHRDRERRDSHKSNRSSTIGNSGDDLDRWRSLRSYSREQSTDGRIVSQCNSRDTSGNRALSPRDNDGFRVPCPVSKSTSNNQRNNGSWASGRAPSIEAGRHSPAPSVASASGKNGEGGGGSRRSRKRSSRGRGRNAEAAQAAHHAAAPAAPVSSSGTLNWREEILESKKHNSHDKPAENNQRVRKNSTMSDKSVSESSTSQPGLIILPQSSISHMQNNQGRGGSMEPQKTLYDHHNPSRPIIVQNSPSKVDTRMERAMKDTSTRVASGYEAGDAARAARHRALLQEVDRADALLQARIVRGPLGLAAHWDDVTETRKFLQSALQRLLMSDLKYCQADNIEHHFWKILYYNFIELLRKSFPQVSPDDKPKIVKLINIIIEEGNSFFESLIQMLEKCYKFNVDDYINDNHVVPPKGLGYVGLALISVQKLYVFLGDLARYKEQVNETNNFAKSKFWYTKAQQINPKNGRPYNQLAILAIYARRKLDAVYYYMRSLMSSNPFHSARESLLSLFDENRKKYEAAERKRRAALEGARIGETSDAGQCGNSGHGLRREVWVRPSGHRTTTVQHDTRDEHLATMTSVELNKSFITSYLHVHGKLITKIGMETFHECASAMLRQFRALLNRQPLPTPAARLLQLTALNMFAVETTAASLKDGGNNGERTAWLECSLGVSLLMFGALLERCCALLPEPPHTQQHADALLLLPAIKVWSDWMLCHSSIWNPPPTFDNFEMESDNDPWDWLAKLMNILEALDDKSIELENEPKEGYVSVRLPEDASLGGFTPLMYMEAATAWVRADPNASHHAAEHALRTSKLLFFGTEYLVGVEPAVLRLEYPAGAAPRYVSAVQRAQPLHPPLQHLSEDSEDEESVSGTASGPTSLVEGVETSPEGADEATKKLLRRKEQLESRKANFERRRERMQEILRGGWVSVEVEIRPRWLVPDTNCFIDHLPLLQAVAAAPAQPYTLAVPLVVMTELEGLKKCSRVGAHALAALTWVREDASAAAVRLATTRGSLLASRAFTAERDQPRATNDDRVLATALSLHENLAAEADARNEDNGETKCVRRVREVVLLTDDRNLRVKALAADMPARDLPSFVQWAGVTHATPPNNPQAPTTDEKNGEHN